MCDRKQRYEDLELDARSGYIVYLSFLGFRTRPYLNKQTNNISMNFSICGKLGWSCMIRAKNFSDYLYKVHAYDGTSAVHAASLKSFLLALAHNAPEL